MLSPRFDDVQAVILRRCSSTAQIANSMANQSRTVEAVVSQHRLKVICDLTLEGVTGSIPSLRTDIDEIMALKAIHTELTLVIVPDTSRFTRAGSSHGQKLLYDLEAKGIFVYFVAEDITSGDQASRIFLSFLFDAANQQARSIARNSTIGSTRSFLDGKSPHCRRPPYGLDRLYLVDGKPQHIIRNLPDGTQVMLDHQTEAVIRSFGRNARGGIPNHYIKQKSESVVLVAGDPAHVAVVHTIFQLHHVEKQSVRSIARHLNDSGIPSPNAREWHVGVVHDILVNGVYLGIGVRNRVSSSIYYQSTAGEPEPANVSLQELATSKRPKLRRRTQDEWLIRPQAQLKEFLPENLRELAMAKIQEHDAKRSSGRSIKPNTNRHADSSYILSGLLRTKQGNHKMTGQSSRGPNGRLYRCYRVSRATSVPKSGDLLRRRLPADAIESAVMGVVKEAILNRSNLVDVIQRTADAVRAEAAEPVDLPQIDKQINRCQKQIVSLSRRLQGDESIDQPIELELDKLQGEVAQLRSKRDRAQTAAHDIALDSTPAIEQLAAEFIQFVETIDSTNPAGVHDALGLLIGRLEVDLETMEIEVELSLPSWMGDRLLKAPPVSLVSAFACKTGHEAHHGSRAILAVFHCRQQDQRPHACFRCGRRAA